MDEAVAAASGNGDEGHVHGVKESEPAETVQAEPRQGEQAVQAGCDRSRAPHMVQALAEALEGLP